MKDKKILIIDDDVSLCRTLSMICSAEGAEVQFATDGRIGLQKFYDVRPDLVLLDIRMPDIDGWETCRHLRMVSDTPVIMLTTLDQDKEIVRGLEYGADDYVTKPFSADVLVARINTQLRRKATTEVSGDANDVQPVDGYADDYLQVDLHDRLVHIRGEKIQLTATEFELLAYLLKRKGKLARYEAILNTVWGIDDTQNKDYVHLYLSYLRKKIEPAPKQPIYLITEYGAGVRFVPQVGSQSMSLS